MSEPTRRERIVGCLLGGAVGDALGAAVEFLSWSEIESRYGPGGIAGFEPAYGGPGRITDDTQMTLFTAEGLIRAQQRLADRGLVDIDAVLHRAYLRWLFTQLGDVDRVPWDSDVGYEPSGWLLGQKFLSARRAPGMTCLSALQTGRAGTPETPLNHSKGCGGVMRVAPVGVVTSESFDLGCRAAAITHGHPTGWLAAGAFAQIVSDVTTGRALRDAVEAAVWRCGSTPGGEETAGALRGALGLVDLERSPSPQQIELLGGGWVAEEALAISVYCALGTPDSAHALRAAVNHSGDSDSTGSITGSILGATLGGVEWIDADLLQQLEGRAEIEQVAHDLCDAFDPDADRDPDWDRYPPW